MPKELNPNHGVTAEMRDQYHKLVAFLVWKFGRGTGKIVILARELELFAQDPRGINLVVHPTNDVLTLMVVSDEEGARLAREAGGLPS